MPKKMTGQSLRSQSILQKQPNYLLPTASLVPMEQPTNPTHKAAPPKEGVPQESCMDEK